MLIKERQIKNIDKSKLFGWWDKASKQLCDVIVVVLRCFGIMVNFAHMSRFLHPQQVGGWGKTPLIIVIIN